MNIWFRRFFAIVFLLAGGRSVAEVGNQVVVLTGARLIDGSGRPAVENSTLVVEGDKIGAAGPGSIKYPTEALVIDCSGKTIIPGLISDHSHIGVVDGTSVKPENYNRENILRQLKQYEAYGVTTVTALGLNAPSFYQLRADQHEGRSPGADVFGADCGIGAPSGAPPVALLPVGKDQIYRPETPDEARAEVREMADRHTDLIKIWVDPLLDAAPIMKPEIYQAVIDEAHRLGLRVAAHIYYLQNAKEVLRAGVDIIAHGVRDKPVDPEFINEMKTRSAFYIATIGLDEASYIYAEQPDWMKGTFFQTALQPALRAQLSDPVYLNRMRTNPRVPIFKKAVALEPGKLADFVILTANPLDDISNTEKIAAVWHRGKKVSGPIGSE